MEPLTLGILGLGRIAKVHIQNIEQNSLPFQIKSVADPYIAEPDVKQTSTYRITRDPIEVLDDPDLQAILICSPVETHVPFIVHAAKSGKHIFCEKPLSLNLDEMHQARQATEKANVKLQIGFNRRFDPHFSAVQSKVVSGIVGHPYLVRITSRDPALPSMDYLKSSGGLFMDMSIHDFDMARYIVGCDVEQVYATGGAWVDSKLETMGDIDTAVIQLKFSNGVLGVIENCRQAAYGYDQRCEVLGSLGQVSADNCVDTSVVYRSLVGQTQDNPLPFFLERYAQSYQLELLAFYQSIKANTPVKASVDDAIKALNLAQAAKQSIQEKRPVSLQVEGI